MINVLMVVTQLVATDGVASFAMNYFKRLDHSKIHMDFAVYQTCSILQEYEDAITKHGCAIYKLPPIYQLKEHYKACERIFQSSKYDVVHDNSLFITYPLMAVAKKINIPVRILHSHNSKMGETKYKEFRNKALLPILKRTATDYAACSPKAGRAMFGKKNFSFVPNVIDVERFKYKKDIRDKVRSDCNISDQFVICTVGRIAAQKNPFFAMDVIEEVIRIDSNVQFWWIGDGPLEEKVKEYTRGKNLENNVIFWGARYNVNDILQGADVFFLPSFFEGLPLCALEAQSSGLFCVVSSELPKEVVLCQQLVRFVDLDMPKKYWSEQLLSEKKSSYERTKAYIQAKSSIFSDSKSGDNLYSLYKNLIKSKEC